MLTKPQASATRYAGQIPWLVVITATLLGAGVTARGAQEPARRFEVVSLRRVPPACGAFEFSLRCEYESQPQRATGRILPGGRLEFTNQVAIDLIRIAYGLERMAYELVSGGPRWLRTERYDLIALTGEDGHAGDQTPEALTEDVRMMLRGLLADRFKLRVRAHPKRQKVMQLRRIEPDRLGPQMGVARGDCPPPPPDSRIMSFSGCVFFQGGQVHAFNVTASDLLLLLAVPTSLPRRDGTGLTARYDVRFTPLLDAKDGSLARELGLELVPATVTLDGVKIERAERPVDD